LRRSSSHCISTFACLFFIGLVALATRMGAFGKRRATSTGLQRASWALVVAVLAQIALGGLVAGSKAGFTYNTWPLMDGELIPGAAKLFVATPFWENFVDNPTPRSVQPPDGRVYLLLGLAISARTCRPWNAECLGGEASCHGDRRAGVLGIVTLLLVVPLWAGLAHRRSRCWCCFPRYCARRKLRFPRKSPAGFRRDAEEQRSMPETLVRRRRKHRNAAPCKVIGALVHRRDRHLEGKLKARAANRKNGIAGGSLRVGECQDCAADPVFDTQSGDNARSTRKPSTSS